MADEQLNVQFEAHLKDLAEKWKEAGVNPDDMLKCATHRRFMFDPNNHFEPTWHWKHEGPEPVVYFAVEVPETLANDLVNVVNNLYPGLKVKRVFLDSNLRTFDDVEQIR